MSVTTVEPSTMNYRQAIADALRMALASDPSVVLLGEDIGAAGGVFKTTAGLFEEFGGERVRDTPISETAIIGAAIGASLRGLRPVAEIMFADFVGVAYDQVANQLAKYRYLSGGQASLPVTVRMLNGAGLGFGAQHSQAVENWFLGVPGLKVLVPATPQDVHGMLRAAVLDPDPVLVFEHKALLERRGRVDRDAPPIPIGVAEVVRAGRDVTVVATQLARWRAGEAAEVLAADGIEVELVDPRTLVPFDDDTVVQSLRRTSRLVVVQEGHEDGGWGSSLVSRVATRHLELLDAPVQIVTSPNAPVPFAAALEAAWLPSSDDVVAAVRRTTSY